MGTDLTRFCALNREGRYDLTAPWVWRGYRYATDARICVRVAAPGEPDTEDRAIPDVDDFYANWTEPAEPLPAMTGIEVTLAEDCDCAWVTCWECQGRVCDGCGCGKRPARECPTCHGAGEYDVTFPAPQPVGPAWMAGKYAALLHTLPGPVLFAFKPVGSPSTYRSRTQGGIYSWRAADGAEGLVGCIQLTDEEAQKYAKGGA